MSPPRLHSVASSVQRKICFHNYPDDTQIYITKSTGGYDPIKALSKCSEQIKDSMCQDFLQLKQDNTEVIAFGDGEEKWVKLKITSCFVVNHPDLSGRLGPVHFLSPESELKHPVF